MNRYLILKKNPLQESSKEFLSWLGGLQKEHTGHYRLITLPSARAIELDFEVPPEFIGNELKLNP
jgi:hypothetical protein